MPYLEIPFTQINTESYKVTFVVVFVRGYDGRETPDREGVRTNQILARLDGILCG